MTIEQSMCFPRVFNNAAAVAVALAPLREQGKKLITTNGCFDIVHAGHVRYLCEAASLGDILVVGVNADATVKKLKGPSRPLQTENDRAFIIASLKSVWAAFVFPEDDPLPFLEILRPDVHVKGGDYTPDIIEKPVVEKHGGVIRIVSFVQGKSTTSIIDKLDNS